MTPYHYQHTKIEPIKVINSINLGFNLGNAYKYLARAGYKGSTSVDIQKAIDYIGFEIETNTFIYSGAKVKELEQVIKIEEKNRLLCLFIQAVIDYYTDDDALDAFVLELRKELEIELKKELLTPNE